MNSSLILISNNPDAPDEASEPLAQPLGLRSVSRPDILTAQRVEVALVLQAMLGTSAANDYLVKHEVDIHVVLRVLSPHGPRRGSHDEFGIRKAQA